MVYLDHAATTPLLPEAVAAMTDELGRVGNASSLHTSGRRARRVVEESRESIAAALGARPSEVVFTAGGTEADNLAVKGLLWSRRREVPRRSRVLASAVEHHAVLDPLHWLASEGEAEVELLEVDDLGRLHPEVLRAALERDPESVALVTAMWANNEVGTVQPIEALAAVARDLDVPMHTDAVQAFGHVPVDFAGSGVDAMTVTAHKLGGPSGVGALVLRRGLDPTPLLHGGGQERDVRSGTLDTAAVAGFAAAVRVVSADLQDSMRRQAALRDELVDAVRAAVPDAQLNGDPGHGPEERLPGNAHFSFPGCEGDSLLLLLDARGIECSTGSACSAGVAEPSHVLVAMGASTERARSSLRFTIGRTTTRADIAALAAALPAVVERARLAGLRRY